MYQAILWLSLSEWEACLRNLVDDWRATQPHLELHTSLRGDVVDEVLQKEFDAKQALLVDPMQHYSDGRDGVALHDDLSNLHSHWIDVPRLRDDRVDDEVADVVEEEVVLHKCAGATYLVDFCTVCRNTNVL